MSAPLRPAAALAVLAALGAGPCPELEPPVRVTLDPASQHQRLDGIGGSAANEDALRRLPEPWRSEVMDLVFGDLEPSVVRLKVRPALEPVNDDGDPAHVNPAGFVRPDDHLWQLEEIFARGSPRLLAAMWTPPVWMKTTGRECCGGTLLPGMEPELAELFSVYLSFLEEAGHPLDWLSVQNEPEAAAPWDSNTYDVLRYAAVAEAVAQRLEADGHATRLVAPDNAVAEFVQLMLPPVLLRPTAAARLHAVAFHLYGTVDYRNAALVGPAVGSVAAATPPGLPYWMTEFSNTTGEGYGSYEEGLWQAELMHETFVHGASQYVIWNLYRPGGPGEALVVIPTDRSGGYTVTPKYWTARQYTKFLRPGAVRVGAASDDPDVRVTAWRDDAAGSWTVVAINRAPEARWVRFAGASLRGPARVVRTAEGEWGQELGPASPERRGPRTVRLPGRSVTTVVWGPAPAAP